MRIQEIASVISARETIIHADNYIDEIVIDTRWIHHTEESLFVALIGKHRNGHAFIDDAYKKGIRSFILLHHSENEVYDDANYLYVNNTLEALHALARYKRSQYQHQVIGITGSNGKTIIKEWLSTILAESTQYGLEKTVCKNPKSFNSKIGVALSLWQLAPTHSIGIFEGGISEPNEMDTIESMIQPTLGILTNIGDAHVENFDSRKELALEKVRLFVHAKQLIYRKDDPVVQEAIEWLQEVNPAITLLDWSTEDTEASFFVTYHTEQSKVSKISILHQQQSYLFSIAFTQKAFIENAIHTLITLIILGLDIDFIREMIAVLVPIGMRLELRDAANNSILIADTYNSDMSSIKVALDYLAQQSGNRKMIIISDISASQDAHKSIVEMINKSIPLESLDKIITIGPTFKKLHEEAYFMANNLVESYNNTDEYLRQFHLSQIHNNIILLKGARKYEFEMIQQRIELLLHNTVMEINLEALTQNLNAYRNGLTKGTKLMAMVKAFSYGHGGVEIAEKLQYEGVDYLAVAYTDEGIDLRSEGIRLPIMVMSPDVNAFESMIRWRLEPEIFSINSLRMFIEKTKIAQETAYPIHIKINTGMNRLGLDASDLDEIIFLLKNNEQVRVASIFSHLAASDDDVHDAFTLQQKTRFEIAVQKIVDSLHYKPLIHLANTSGIFHKSSLQYSMVRLGIGLYGINTSQHKKMKLKPVATLKSYIVQIRHVPQGETVGYSRKGVLHRDSIIATVAIGYADGYYRDFGNGVAAMLVKGKKAKVVGSVCMDMTMIDVTDIEGVAEGDEVIIFGPALPVSDLADKAHTIPYEILTGISQRVKRIFVEG